MRYLVPHQPQCNGGGLRPPRQSGDSFRGYLESANAAHAEPITNYNANDLLTQLRIMKVHPYEGEILHHMHMWHNFCRVCTGRQDDPTNSGHLHPLRSAQPKNTFWWTSEAPIHVWTKEKKTAVWWAFSQIMDCSPNWWNLSFHNNNNNNMFKTLS